MAALELLGRPRRRVCEQVRREEPNCWRCGLPIDLSLPRSGRVQHPDVQLNRRGHPPLTASARPTVRSARPQQPAPRPPPVQQQPRERDQGEAWPERAEESGVVSDEFNPEQRVMIAVMRTTGVSDPETVVRADRLTAYLFGSYLTPVLCRLADAAAQAMRRISEAEGGKDAEELG